MKLMQLDRNQSRLKSASSRELEMIWKELSVVVPASNPWEAEAGGASLRADFVT